MGAKMFGELNSSYPVMVQAFQSPIREEEVITIEGCHREACGAWGMGVCRFTVKLPEAGSKETQAESTSQTSILKVGCISCGDLELSISESGSETEPVQLMDFDPNDDSEQHLFDAGNLHLPAAFDRIRTQTQERVDNISLI